MASGYSAENSGHGQAPLRRQWPWNWRDLREAQVQRLPSDLGAMLTVGNSRSPAGNGCHASSRIEPPLLSLLPSRRVLNRERLLSAERRGQGHRPSASAAAVTIDTADQQYGQKRPQAVLRPPTRYLGSVQPAVEGCPGVMRTNGLSWQRPVHDCPSCTQAEPRPRNDATTYAAANAS
jgi:hypothetical protein